MTGSHRRESPEVSPLPPPLFRFPGWAGPVVWIGAATVATLGRVVDAAIRDLPVSSTELVWTYGLSWLILAAWSPVALRLARGPSGDGGRGRIGFSGAGIRRLAAGFLVLHLASQCTTALVEVTAVGPILGHPEQPLLVVLAGYVARRLVFTLLIMGAIVGFDLVEQVMQAERERRAEASRLTVALRDARLAELRAELRPHFVFNTLNAIGEAVGHDPAEADRMIAHLGELLRATYETPAVEHSLRDELALAEGYMAIQRIRYPDQLRDFRVEVDPACLECAVPAMILQPILENAVRHGVLPSSRPGRVRVRGHLVGDDLRLEVENEGAPYVAAARRGVGLRNTRERLALLHGAEGRLEITGTPEGGTCVTLSWPVGSPTPAAVGA